MVCFNLWDRCSFLLALFHEMARGKENNLLLYVIRFLTGEGGSCEIIFVFGKIILDTIDQIVPATCIEGKADDLVISKPSKEDNNGQSLYLKSMAQRHHLYLRLTKRF